MSTPGDTQENAMTEIALAMAMGFFSIMILTMISMGVPRQDEGPKTVNVPVINLVTAKEAPRKLLKVEKNDVFLVFDGKAYLDRNLKIVKPLEVPSDRRVILALIPDLPITKALSAQKPFVGRKIILTALNSGWESALQAKKKEENYEK